MNIRRRRAISAFGENANLIGLGATVAVTLGMLNTSAFLIPLSCGLLVETIYLAFYSKSAHYAAVLQRHRSTEAMHRRKAKKERIWPMLLPEMQTRLSRLETTHHFIVVDGPPVGFPTDSRWFQQLHERLDVLFEKWMEFAESEARFRHHLQSVLFEECIGESGYALNSGSGCMEETAERIQTHYGEELQRLGALQECENDLEMLSIRGKRLDVLQRRQAYVGEIGRLQYSLNLQLDLLEDSFALIADELRARHSYDSRQILAEIEEALLRTAAMSRILEDMASAETLRECFARETSHQK